MSHIYEALKKLDRETSAKRFGWGPIGKEILKSGPPRPRKRISSYLIHVLLTAFITAAITYGVTLKSDLLWKSTSPLQAPEIIPAPGPQVAQIPPSVTEAPKTLPPAPDAQGSKVPPSVTETTKILPPAPSKSSAPIQKIAPPSPEAGSLQKPAPSNPPRYAVPDRKRVIPPLASGSSPKVPPFPQVQPLLLEDDEAPVQPIQPGAPIYTPPDLQKEIEARKQRREAYRSRLEGYQKNLPAERKTPVPPPTGGMPGPGFIPRGPEMLPGASPQAAPQTPNTFAGGLPRLKISGIVWHEQPAMRRAVINGSFATEGSHIEGVKVMEILPTRVRFSYRNQVFELSAFE
jgi:hypothetical protein